jgi:hypothetical protein
MAEVILSWREEATQLAISTGQATSGGARGGEAAPINWSSSCYTTNIRSVVSVLEEITGAT